MKVRLISVTRPAGIGAEDSLTPEDLIVYTARVSSPKSQAEGQNPERLLRYLVSHKHWSPFEMVDLTLEIETSRAIAAQILRHRSFSFQEFSQRYATASLGVETYEARRQDVKNRQNSIDDMSSEDRAWFREEQKFVATIAEQSYQQALKRGIAREQARMMLPLSTTTRLYMKGSVRSWIHYFQSRLAPETQKEHRDVAQAAFEVFKAQFPVTAAAVFEEEK